MNLLRKSMLMSVITYNLEVSFNLSDKNIKSLHDLDMQLLRGSLLLGAKSSQSLMLLELGLIPVSFLLKKKKIMYLFHLLNTDESSLVGQVFQKQLQDIKSIKKGEWINTVLEDLKELNIELTFSEIATMSKEKFKSLVKKSTETAALKSLVTEVGKRSKGKEIAYECLGMQSYLQSSSGLSLESMRRIYHIRCREIQVKANFPSSEEDQSCPFPGCTSPDTQLHLFSSSCFSENNEVTKTNTQYNDIFGLNIEAQFDVMQIIFSRLEKRRTFLSFPVEGFPADPRRRLPSSNLGIQKAKIRSKGKIKRKQYQRITT